MILIYGDSPVPPETEVTLLPNETRRNHDLAHLEDLALKSAADYFGAELLHWLGIPGKMIRSSPTEIVELETRHMYEDFLFELEDGTWCHFEFESDAITPEDLKRFREYEATTARRVNAPVITYVICSSKASRLLDHITEGINTYRVKVIRLKDHDQKKLLDSLKEKASSGLDRTDIIPLLLSPLMAEEETRKDCLLQGIRILKITEEKHIFSQNEIRKMEAILYAFALKYFRDMNLAAIKEEIAMTELGQMIWDDALAEGQAQGLAKGLAQGQAQGQQQASERYSKLILILDKEKKNDLIIKVASDPDFREELYRKYGI